MITRLEIIDDTSNNGQEPVGRTVIVSPKDNKVITFDLQDDGRTLKIFIGNVDKEKT